MQSFDGRIQFTGIVITYNEARHLRECLRSLAFCEQMIVIDLGSTDRTVEIAKECGAKVVPHERVPIVEQIRAKAVSYAKNDWIIFLDPDEILYPKIEVHLRYVIARNPKVGLINIPWKFYFKGKPLDFCVWGTEKTKGVVMNRQRVRFSTEVHGPIHLLKGYESETLPSSSGHFIKHYWVDSFAQMIEKHRRYIKYEGCARYARGQCFSWHHLVRETVSALKRNLFDLSGIRSGGLGIFLSVFYAWYVCMSFLSLRKYQRSLNR